jgi:hypothetical protein
MSFNGGKLHGGKYLPGNSTRGGGSAATRVSPGHQYWTFNYLYYARIV